MILSEKYKDDNVTSLITEQTSRILNGINEKTKLIVIIGEQGSGRTVLAKYIQDRYSDFEIIDNFDWLNVDDQLKELKQDKKLIIVSKKLCNLSINVVDSADILICTSNKDSKMIIDRLKYIVMKENIKVDEIELVQIADQYGQDIRGAINHLHKYTKNKEY